MESRVASTEERKLQFNIDADAFRNACSLKVKRGLAFGWTDLIGNGFRTVWPYCSLSMKRNYLSSHSKMTTTPYWTGNAVCRMDRCINVKFIVQHEPDADATTITVKAHITSVCGHAESAEASTDTWQNDRQIAAGLIEQPTPGTVDLSREIGIVNESSCTADSVKSVLNESHATKAFVVHNDDLSQNNDCNALSTAESEDDCTMGLVRNDSSGLHFEFVTKHSGLKIQILKADVTTFTSDGIVNAANGHLRHYGGVARAISDAAGPELELECRKYIEKHGTVKTTDVDVHYRCAPVVDVYTASLFYTPLDRFMMKVKANDTANCSCIKLSSMFLSMLTTIFD